MVIYLLTTICGFTPQAIAKKGVKDTTSPLAKMLNKKHGAGVCLQLKTWRLLGPLLSCSLGLFSMPGPK